MGKGKAKHTVMQKAPGLNKSVPMADRKMEKTTVQRLSWSNLNPSWRVRHIEMCDPFGWHVIGSVKRSEILKKLGEFESMTVSDVFVKAKKQNHAIDVDKITAEARKRLGETGHSQTIELVSLHLSGKERIWGVLEGSVVSLLWWDPNHEICPSILKHT